MSKRARNNGYIGTCQNPLIHSCTLCRFTSKSIAGIKLHQKVVHKIENPIVKKGFLHERCSICRKEFKSIKEVIKHLKTHR